MNDVVLVDQSFPFSVYPGIIIHTTDLSKVVPDLQAPTVAMPTHADSAPTFSTQEQSSQSSSDTTDAPPPTLTFLSLKDRLLHLLFTAIQTESDPVNVQMLLHGLMVFTQDIGLLAL